MLEGKAMVKETDMPEKMQIQAMSSASQALDVYDVFDCISIAAYIKKVLFHRYYYYDLLLMRLCVSVLLLILGFSGMLNFAGV